MYVPATPVCRCMDAAAMAGAHTAAVLQRPALLHAFSLSCFHGQLALIKPEDSFKTDVSRAILYSVSRVRELVNTGLGRQGGLVGRPVFTLSRRVWWLTPLPIFMH